MRKRRGLSFEAEEEAPFRPVAGVVLLRSEAADEESQLRSREAGEEVHVGLLLVAVQPQSLHKAQVQQQRFCVGVRAREVAAVRPAAEVPHGRTAVQARARLQRTSVR